MVIYSRVGYRVRNAAAVVVCITYLAACAYQRHLEERIRPEGFYSYRQTIDGITLACEPYLRSAATFGTELLDKGILPLRFILFNSSDGAYDLSKVRVKVSDDQGRELAAKSVAEVAKEAKYSTPRRTAGWALAGAVFLLIPSIPFALVGFIDSYRANKHIRRALEEGAKRPDVLEKWGETAWFVYLGLPDRSPLVRYELAGKDFLVAISNLRSIKTGRRVDFSLAFTTKAII